MSHSRVDFYSDSAWRLLLWPLSLLFRLLTAIRRRLQQGSARPPQPRVPVIIVGNITLGGTGKTPLLIQLAKYLRKQGFKPGVVSRGYGAKTTTFPLQVSAKTTTESAGDEAVLIARESACPVVIDPDRTAALDYLLQHHEVDVVLSDDGLQHYKLYRDLEIAVVDGQRLFGNELCLPAGPLREPLSRLQEVDCIVVNGREEDRGAHPLLADAFVMEVQPRYLVNQVSGEKRTLGGAPFKMGSEVVAVAGIGNPQRFFETVRQLPYPVQTHAFPDHHGFTEEDFARLGIAEHTPVVMTEKDAVKCRGFAGPNFWAITIEVSLPDTFFSTITDKLKTISSEA